MDMVAYYTVLGSVLLKKGISECGGLIPRCAWRQPHRQKQNEHNVLHCVVVHIC